MFGLGFGKGLGLNFFDSWNSEKCLKILCIINQVNSIFMPYVSCWHVPHIEAYVLSRPCILQIPPFLSWRSYYHLSRLWNLAASSLWLKHTACHIPFMISTLINSAYDFCTGEVSWLAGLRINLQALNFTWVSLKSFTPTQYTVAPRLRERLACGFQSKTRTETWSELLPCNNQRHAVYRCAPSLPDCCWDSGLYVKWPRHQYKYCWVNVKEMQENHRYILACNSQAWVAILYMLFTGIFLNS